MCYNTTGGISLAGSSGSIVNGNSSITIGNANSLYYDPNRVGDFGGSAWTTTPIYQYGLGASSTNIIISCDPYLNMKTNLKQLDDKIVLIAELAGFSKEQVKVKYYNPSKDEKNGKAYISIEAEVEEHALKRDCDDTYKLSHKENLDNVKLLNFESLKTSFENGLLVIEIEYDETSKIKEVKL